MIRILLAGMIWLAGDIALLAAAAAVMLGWFHYEEQETKRVDARLGRERRLPRKEAS